MWKDIENIQSQRRTKKIGEDSTNQSGIPEIFICGDQLAFLQIIAPSST